MISQRKKQNEVCLGPHPKQSYKLGNSSFLNKKEQQISVSFPPQKSIKNKK